MRNITNVINQCVIISAFRVSPLFNVTCLWGCIRWRSSYRSMWLTGYSHWTDCIWHPLSVETLSGFPWDWLLTHGHLLYPTTLFVLVILSVILFPSPASLSHLPPWPQPRACPQGALTTTFLTASLLPCQVTDPMETLNPWAFYCLLVVSTFCFLAHPDGIAVTHLKIRARLDDLGAEKTTVPLS